MTAEPPRLVAVTALSGATGGPATAAAVGVALARAGAEEPLGVIVLDGEAGPRRRPTLVSSGAARALESQLGTDVQAAARGALCAVSAPEGELAGALERCRSSGAAALVVYAPPSAWRELVDGGEIAGAVLRADAKASRPLTGLAARELISSGVATGVVPRPPGLVASRRALAGIEPGGELGLRARRFAQRLARAQGGQAMPITLFLALAAIVAGVLLAILGAAATGASRYQRAADLAAVSAARSLRDDHHRLFLPATLANGMPNPAHLSEAEYRRRATAAAYEAAELNGAGSADSRVTFPGGAFAPTRVKVELEAVAELEGEASAEELSVTATAEAYPLAAGGSAAPAVATGGGYAGPLATRQGEGMRPDVARAFDSLSAAASASGHALTVNSAYRSDAEQAALFAANPDPRMVARPGTSLHRCGTELDLGPPSAYGWLAQNAGRFGFTQRYSWEAWHYGYVRGPAPCSASGDAVAQEAEGGDGASSEAALPALRARALPRSDRAGLVSLERSGQSPRGSAPRRVELQPTRRLAGGGQWDRPVHAGDRRLLRTARPVRPGCGHRRPGSPDGRPPRPVRGRLARPRRVQRRSGAGHRLLVRAPLRRDAGLCGPDPRPHGRGGSDRAARPRGASGGLASG